MLRVSCVLLLSLQLPVWSVHFHCRWMQVIVEPVQCLSNLTVMVLLWCSVNHFSQKFNTCQLNYSVIEKETLGLVWALQHFEVYVNSGAPLVVYTDDSPIVFLRSLSCPK